MPVEPWTNVPHSEETTYWQSLVTGDFLEIAATALFFYEYFLVLPDEVKYVWKMKKSIASYLFLVNRYVVLCVRGFRLVQMVSWEGRNELIADQICTAAWRIGDAFTIAMYLVLALFASLRTYAIWEKNRIIFVVVLILGLIYPSGFTYSITTRVYRAAPPPFTGCDYDTSLNLSIKLDPNMIYSMLGIICSMVFEATVVVLTWTKTFTLFRRRRQIDGRVDKGMGYILLRDGTIHFTTLVLLNAIGLITFIFTPFDFISPLTDTMISILISRLILNLRQDFIGVERNTMHTSASNMSDMSTVCWMSQGRMGDASNVTVRFASGAGEDVELHEECDVERRYRENSDTWEMGESTNYSSPTSSGR